MKLKNLNSIPLTKLTTSSQGMKYNFSMTWKRKSKKRINVIQNPPMETKLNQLAVLE